MENTKPKNRVMFFSAHPDDELASTGGFMIKNIKNGGKVKMVLCIDPSSPRFDTTAETEKQTRLNEYEKVAKNLGAESKFLNFGHYPALSYEHILPCVKEIRIFKPDIVIMLQENDYHTEHQMIAKIVKRAVWHASRAAFPECGKPHQVKQIWEAEGDRPMPDPNHHVDITKEIKAKLKTFLLYASQQKRKNLASAFEGINRYHGVMYKKGEYAEAYKVTEFFYG